MLVSNKKGMWLLVMSAARQINWKLVKSVVGKVELVALDQVPQITGCISGAVPPFGSVLGDVYGLIATRARGLYMFQCGKCIVSR